MVTHACDPSIWEAETGKKQGKVSDHSGPHSENLSQKQTKSERKRGWRVGREVERAVVKETEAGVWRLQSKKREGRWQQGGRDEDGPCTGL